MFVKQNKSWKGTLLTYTIGYRENGKVKHKNIETIGYLEDLMKEYDDPIAHFKKLAKEKSNQEVNELVIKNLSNKTIEWNNEKKNLGYAILKTIYQELDLNKFFSLKQKKLNIEYNLNDIFELLTYSRILYPGSKLETYDKRNRFFENYDFSLKDLYRSLDYFQSFQEDLQSWIWNHTEKEYARDTSTVYYDCTNYYFEISYNDSDLVDEFGNVLEKNYRKKGPSKEHRPEPIIQMGLLMDKNGIPISYNLFPGNESEKVSLLPSLRATKKNCDLKRIITVADRGLNTSDNVFYIAGKNDDKLKDRDGYIFGQSILGGDKKFKEYVLDPNDYIVDTFKENGATISFKHKSRIYGKEIVIKKENKRNQKIVVYQKQMIYFSEKYAAKQKKQRELVLEKARDLIANPGKYTRATSIGATGYINNIDFNKKTGEVIAKDLSINEDKIREEEQFDGYYSIVTSELNMTDKELRDTYKGLWEIEETFKISKSNLKARPVYVWTKEHIEAHFLNCFISLVIIRLLEKKLENNFSTERIIESLRNYTSTKVEHDIYIQDFYNEVLDEISKKMHINLSRKYLSLSEIKNIL